MKEYITFILPTRDRTDYVARAIDSCLACEHETLGIRVMVIDASADSRCMDMLRARYATRPAVEVLQQPAHVRGFMGACFFAVERLETRYATFMYDDDVLSPHISEMYLRMVDRGVSFAMGFGQTNHADKVLQFRPIDNWGSPSWWGLLLAWYGNARWQYRPMPVSPICCLTTSDLLKRWMVEVSDFSAQNEFRQYYIMRRNIGGDLMIYLHSVIDSEKDILLAQETVAQWSEHPDSMTVVAEELDLFAGYWLARCWAVGYCARAGDMPQAARLAGYVTISGLATARRAKRIGRPELAESILSEIRTVFRQVGAARVIGQIAVAATSIAFSKMKRLALARNIDERSVT